MTSSDTKPRFGALEILKYIGPGLLVTVGFIDPGNWAANIGAGSNFGYQLLWMVTLSTIMLIVLQHNAAHLGIASGLCLAEAATKFTPRRVSLFLLLSALAASISTSLAEILGAAIALQMLFAVPIPLGATLATLVVSYLLFSNSYRRLEKYIIGFVSLIGLSFIYEIFLVRVDWPQALAGWTTPALPAGSLPFIIAVLGAVVMPHNLFLHSEIIQSRQWNHEDPATIKRQLRYEYIDTIVSMIIGWAINSAIILLAATAFFSSRIHVGQLSAAHSLLKPLLGNSAGLLFGLALLFSGIASSITSGLAGATISAGINGEPYDIRDKHSKIGAAASFAFALLIILFIHDTFQGLLISQMFLSFQLPFTIALQIYLTSSKKVMGSYVNSRTDTLLLYSIGLIVTVLNALLLISIISH
ncbi:Mg2+/Co2+ transporter [Candidatus Wirthbacteria bacterium CG2_30_54_11]|uniref:Mg2+/Co2+ transporter n=1 Tax=Candidatus Wirthbacteria bacterium CG2_30_54_11 TaxID=1817892 RepID=A0A1J5IN91_9BACT|nr:MAG: Mg2+/Co2+ transporter [Candidatus Wirthbacteria bacterium CG2_30_54_11]